jgi:hypothetical protein
MYNLPHGIGSPSRTAHRYKTFIAMDFNATISVIDNNSRVFEFRAHCRKLKLIGTRATSASDLASSRGSTMNTLYTTINPLVRNSAIPKIRAMYGRCFAYFTSALSRVLSSLKKRESSSFVSCTAYSSLAKFRQSFSCIKRRCPKIHAQQNPLLLSRDRSSAMLDGWSVALPLVRVSSFAYIAVWIIVSINIHPLGLPCSS